MASPIRNQQLLKLTGMKPKQIVNDEIEARVKDEHVVI